MKTIDYLSIEKVENKSWTRGKRESGEKGEERRAGGERGGERGDGKRLRGDGRQERTLTEPDVIVAYTWYQKAQGKRREQ